MGYSIAWIYEIAYGLSFSYPLFYSTVLGGADLVRALNSDFG